MAVVNYEIEAQPSGHMHPEGVRVVVWRNLANLDTGSPFFAPHYAEKSVQASGTPSTAICTMQGSNAFTGTPEWGTLADGQGNALVFTNTDISANKIETILE